MLHQYDHIKITNDLIRVFALLDEGIDALPPGTRREAFYNDLEIFLSRTDETSRYIGQILGVTTDGERTFANNVREHLRKTLYTMLCLQDAIKDPSREKTGDNETCLMSVRAVAEEGSACVRRHLKMEAIL